MLANIKVKFVLKTINLSCIPSNLWSGVLEKVGVRLFKLLYIIIRGGFQSPHSGYHQQHDPEFKLSNVCPCFDTNHGNVQLQQEFKIICKCYRIHNLFSGWRNNVHFMTFSPELSQVCIVNQHLTRLFSDSECRM